MEVVGRRNQSSESCLKQELPGEVARGRWAWKRESSLSLNMIQKRLRGPLGIEFGRI